MKWFIYMSTESQVLVFLWINSYSRAEQHGRCRSRTDKFKLSYAIRLAAASFALARAF
jgi:hypothetical protein